MFVVGAQAIYLQAGATDLAVAEFTTDADLAVDPSALAEAPAVGEALRSARFVAGLQPGTCSRDGVDLDLLVPEAIGGAGRRGARLPRPHGNSAARKVKGLEGVLVDYATIELRALDSDRRMTARVAGPAALLVSKVHKIADREQDSDRLADKDALDVLRLLQGIATRELADGIRKLLADERSRAVTEQALVLFARLFATPDGVGVEIVIRATEGLESPDVIGQSFIALARELLRAIRAT